ncbi:MAG: ABC transporter substrate-binding protein [Streptosporangiaceae bacterium]
MRPILRVPLVIAAAATLAAAAGCGGGSSAPKAGGGGGGGGSGGPIVIGSIHPLTGPLAGDGKLMDDAVKMAVDDINAAGGIKALDGRKLAVKSGDSQGKPEVGQSEAQRIIQSGATALVGTYQSDVTQNVAAVAERNQVPLVIDVAVADQILQQGYRYTFRVQPNASSMGRLGADDLARISEGSVKTVAYLHDSSDFGTSVSKAFTKEASTKGIRVVKDVSYDPASLTDATTIVSKAASAHPDVIVVTGYYADSLLIAKTIASVKPDVRAVYGIADGGFDNHQFPKDAGKAAAGYLSTNYHFSATNPEVKKIRKQFEQKYGEPMRTDAVLAYQAVQVIAKGLEQAGSTDPTKLRDAISGLRIDEPLVANKGPIVFNDKGQNVHAIPIVMQVRSGKVRQVYPAKYAEAKLKFPAPPEKS